MFGLIKVSRAALAGIYVVPWTQLIRLILISLNIFSELNFFLKTTWPVRMGHNSL